MERQEGRSQVGRPCAIRTKGFNITCPEGRTSWPSDLQNPFCRCGPHPAGKKKHYFTSYSNSFSVTGTSKGEIHTFRILYDTDTTLKVNMTKTEGFRQVISLPVGLQVRNVRRMWNGRGAQHLQFFCARNHRKTSEYLKVAVVAVVLSFSCFTYRYFVPYVKSFGQSS